MASRVFFLLGLHIAILSAQPQTASLRGEIKDHTGAVIANAPLELHSTAPQLHLQRQAGPTGQFLIESLPPAKYSLTIAVPGFQRLTINSIPLASGETRTLPSLTLTVSVMGGCQGVGLDHLRFLPSASTASLTGSITESTATLSPQIPTVRHARVQLICPRGNPCAYATTDAEGRFTFPRLAPGTYSIRILHPSFYAREVAQLHLRPGFESVFYPIELERCPRGNCDPAFRPRKSPTYCE